MGSYVGITTLHTPIVNRVTLSVVWLFEITISWDYLLITWTSPRITNQNLNSKLKTLQCTLLWCLFSVFIACEKYHTYCRRNLRKAILLILGQNINHFSLLPCSLGYTNEAAIKNTDSKGKQALISYLRLLYSKVVYRFLSLTIGSIQEEVIGKWTYHADGFGLEIQVCFHFYGHDNTNTTRGWKHLIKT